MGHGLGRFSRRALIAGAGGLGLGVVTERAAIAQAGELRMMCWSGYNEPGATAGFRNAAGMSIRAETIGSNDEIFGFLRAGGIGTYDIVTPSSGVVESLAAEGLIQPLDAARLPNLTGVMARFRDTAWSVYRGELMAVPLTWHTAPILLNPRLMPDPPAAWLDLQADTFTDRLVLHDDAIGHLVTANRALGAADPVRVTKEALNSAMQLLIRIKRNRVKTFVSGLVEVTDELSNGRAAASLSGSETALRFRAGPDELRVWQPDPGGFSICDALCIPVGAPHVDSAYAFIDHMLSSEAQIAFANALLQATVVDSAVPGLSEEARGLFDYTDLDRVFGQSPIVGYPPFSPSGDLATWVDWVIAWDRVRVTATREQAPPSPSPEPTSIPAGTPPAG